ncbi:hypothetical protein D3C75_798870 [compost metagenome]
MGEKNEAFAKYFVGQSYLKRWLPILKLMLALEMLPLNPAAEITGINFAKTGTPRAEELPAWEAYNREKGATMILDTESELVHNHDKKLMGLLEPDNSI